LVQWPRCLPFYPWVLCPIHSIHDQLNFCYTCNEVLVIPVWHSSKSSLNFYCSMNILFYGFVYTIIDLVAVQMSLLKYKYLLYTYKWNIEKYWWNKMLIFIFAYFHCKKYFSLQWNIFSVFFFHWCLAELLSSKFSQYIKFKEKSFKWLCVKKEKNVYNKQKIQVFFMNTGLIFILWYENYHISLVATVTHEIFIFISLDENKSCINRKKLEYPLLSIYLFKYKLNK
jgi:hypothetical protein